MVARNLPIVNIKDIAIRITCGKLSSTQDGRLLKLRAPASSIEMISGHEKQARGPGEKKRPARCAGERGGVLLLPG
jgi:hypothetical protein